MNKINNNFNNKNKKAGFFLILLFYYKKYIWYFLLMSLFIIISSFCAILIPKLLERILDKNILTNPNLSKFYQLAILIISILILRSIFIFFNNFIGGRLGRIIEIDLRNRIFNKLNNLDISFYSDKNLGELLTKIISDTEIVGRQSQTIPQSILSSMFTSIGLIIILFTINVKLTIITLFFILIVIIFLLTTFYILRNSIQYMRKVVTDINGDISDRISNISLIKTSGTEEFENKRLKKIHNLYYDSSKKPIKYTSLLISFLLAALGGLNVLILLIGIILWRNNLLGGWGNNYISSNDINGLSIVIAFMSGITSLILPIMSLSRLLGLLAQASSSGKRINDLLKEKSLITNLANGIKLDRISSDIIFSKVNFAYPQKSEINILKDFTYTFKLGKSYAFVGETGIGKSTILKLILRLYDPTSGYIFIKNKDKKINLKNLDLNSYLQNIGYVEQEPSIFADSFYENIKYSSFNATKEEIIKAAKKAEIDDFIVNLKDGYNTKLGPNGITLSGGQKQRLVIARMFLKDPDILILDEATSSLDNIVEYKIQVKLDELMKNRTTFIIAHRLTTIKNVDYILVLEKNKNIVQIGKFQDLIKIPGHFKDIYNAGMLKK